MEAEQKWKERKKERERVRIIETVRKLQALKVRVTVKKVVDRKGGERWRNEKRKAVLRPSSDTRPFP